MSLALERTRHLRVRERVRARVSSVRPPGAAAADRPAARACYVLHVPVVKLVLAYDGTRYVGWQVQPNGPSVQAEVERALGTLHKGVRRVVAAGRTDAGVHAAGQVVSFAEERPLPRAAYVQGMNALLPDDVAVRDAAVEPDGFDARRSATGKRYRYRIENGPTRDPLTRRLAWQVFRPLDVAAMRDAGAALVGRHDFAAFQASDCEAHHAIRDVTSLAEVGLGRRAAGSIPALLASRDRTRAGPTAPPQGLCLEEVFYGGPRRAGSPPLC
jgi:tRNA pseudouridine38-40 synthase